MDLFLTMAGEYSRFKNEGYQIPKFLLPWGHRTILSELLNQFMDYKFDNIYLIMHKKDMDYYNHIQKTCDYYTSGNFKIIVIDDTNSQSETLLRGIEKSNSQSRFIVHNIDTILYNRDYLRINNELNNADGYIDLFSSQNHKYSYEKDLILDPFIGSGTTAIAAKKLNRNYIGYEISKEYCELANNRIKEN